MSQMIAIRIDEDLLGHVDRERRGRGLSRTRAVEEALRLWLERHHFEEAVRREHEAYKRKPVRRSEFDAVLGARTWPK
jgi:metal-responsive CopG/Arc/MetJ family transcriptional regulator